MIGTDCIPRSGIIATVFVYFFGAVWMLQGQNIPANSSEEDEFGTQGVARGVQDGPGWSRYHVMGHS